MIFDPLSPYTLTETVLVAGVWAVLIFAPGKTIYRLLPAMTGELAERIAIPFAIGYLLLHPLAYAMFLAKSNVPWFLYLAGCVACAGREIYSCLQMKARGNAPTEATTLRVIAWALLTGAILYLVLFQHHYGMFREEIPGKMYGAIFPWDELHHSSMLNESRRFFFPGDNPFIPGEAPFYLSWLGNVMASLLSKAGVDQTHAYYLWSPLFFHLNFFWILYYIIRRLGGTHGSAFFAIGFFYLAPKIGLGEVQLRYLAGIYLILCTLIFIKAYLDHPHIAFLILSFSWIWLYAAKGNYLPPLLPGLALFHLMAVLDLKSRSIRWKELVLCLAGVAVLVFMAWVSRSQFGIMYFPGSLVEFNLERNLKLAQNIIVAFPIVAVLGYARIRFLRQSPIGKMEILLWTWLTGIMAFGILYGLHMSGGAELLAYYGIAAALPVLTQKVLKNEKAFLAAGVVTLAAFAVIYLDKPPFEKGGEYIMMTADEIEALRFLRQQTPADSVFMHNVPRYYDRPAILSSLAYRKSFLDEAERFANSYQRVLQSRIYEYWNFLFCNCTTENQRYFFSQHPRLDYLVEYDSTFLKKLTPIAGMPAEVFPVHITRKNPEIMREVFHSNNITIYQIRRS